jgi:hypothetical protein
MAHLSGARRGERDLVADKWLEIRCRFVSPKVDKKLAT